MILRKIFSIGFLVLLVIFPVNSTFAQSGTLSIEGFDVPYDIDGGTILSAFLDPDFVELIVLIDSANDGLLEITIPRQLLDAKFGESDDVFFVLVDGFETDYVEFETTANSRTIIIPFFAGDEIFEVIGTKSIGFEAEPEIEIPDWVRNNAGWWSKGLIGDSDFVLGIQYLIKEGIMTIPETQSGSPTTKEIPSWIKNNAGWWADGLIGDSDFVSGIQYLITHGIMVV